MKHYLKGAILESVERAKKIKASIPNEALNVYFYPLVQKCDSLVDLQITSLKESLDFLKRDGLEPIVLDRLRNSVSQLDQIEYGPLVALNRSHKDDENLNILLDRIRKEIKYPISPPLACCLSNDYFYVDPDFNIMYLPALELNFLLHIPDVYHELGHPLFDANNNPKVEPFKSALGNVNFFAIEHFNSETIKEKRNSNRLITECLRNWKDNWVRSWAVELFCDLFAVFMVGPAFAWSHLHLCAKRGTDPFHTPLYSLVDHPADHARMEAMLLGLKLIGFGEHATTIESKWNEFLSACEIEKVPEFERAYPKQLLEHCVNYCHQAMITMKCRIVNTETNDSIFILLNEAWDKFWQDSDNYFKWEAEQISKITKENPK